MSVGYLRDVFFGGSDGPGSGGPVGEVAVVLEGVVDDVVAGRVGDVVDAGVLEGVRDRQVLLRVSERQRDDWQRAADADGADSLSGWLRGLADGRVREVLFCSHPVGERRVYAWSEFCLRCGVRLR